MAVNIAYELDNRDGNEHRVIRITSKPLRYYRWEIESNDDESLHSKIDPEGNSFSTSNRTVVLHFEKNVLFVFFFENGTSFHQKYAFIHQYRFPSNEKSMKSSIPFLIRSR